jgi:hypothetical protein
MNTRALLEPFVKRDSYQPKMGTICDRIDTHVWVVSVALRCASPNGDGHDIQAIIAELFSMENDRRASSARTVSLLEACCLLLRLLQVMLLICWNQRQLRCLLFPFRAASRQVVWKLRTV